MEVSIRKLEMKYGKSDSDFARENYGFLFNKSMYKIKDFIITWSIDAVNPIDNSEYLNIQMVNHPQGGLNHISIGTNFNLDAEHNGITFSLSL